MWLVVSCGPAGGSSDDLIALSRLASAFPAIVKPDRGQDGEAYAGAGQETDAGLAEQCSAKDAEQDAACQNGSAGTCGSRVSHALAMAASILEHQQLDWCRRGRSPMVNAAFTLRG